MQDKQTSPYTGDHLDFAHLHLPAPSTSKLLIKPSDNFGLSAVLLAPHGTRVYAGLVFFIPGLCILHPSKCIHRLGTSIKFVTTMSSQHSGYNDSGRTLHSGFSSTRKRSRKYRLSVFVLCRPGAGSKIKVR